MQTITLVSEMQALSEGLRTQGKRIALVPTMGALHEGHMSLVKLAREKGDFVVVSIFVNPTQFGPSEDFTKYPRLPETDLEACRAAGVDCVFAPEVEEMYPKGYSTFVVEEHIAKPLEGASRPSHFRGVTTVVAKLFNIVKPHCSIFGQKDAQQVAVLTKMNADLNFGVEIVVAPTLRESDGLAISSRNRYLTNTQRVEALVLSRALRKATDMVEAGERRVDRLVAEATHLIGEHRRVRIIYVSIVDRQTMEAVKGEITPGKVVMTIAAWVDEVRLIDNQTL